MRTVVIAILLLFSTSAMAATFTYTPVHVAPVVHVNPVVRVNSGVHVKPIARPVGRAALHSHQGPLPVAAYTVPPKQKCADQKSGSTGCPKN